MVEFELKFIFLIPDAFFPNWLNHIMHTNVSSCDDFYVTISTILKFQIMIFVIMELFTSYRSYPSRKAGLVGLSIFMASYLGWIHVIKYNANIWVYPILDGEEGVDRRKL